MNARPDILFEARLAEQLQRARRNEMGVLAAARGARGGPLLLDLATRAGAATLGLDTGALAVGKPLDGVHVDVSAPSFAPAIARGADALLDALVSVGTPAHVRDVFVAGKRIVSGGRVTGVDDDAVSARIRSRRFS
jgi:cytosine/adenosine deaminase-related metal-dependent hydrolase